MPDTRNTTIRGPSAMQAARKLPGPSSLRLVTAITRAASAADRVFAEAFSAGKRRRPIRAKVLDHDLRLLVVVLKVVQPPFGNFDPIKLATNEDDSLAVKHDFRILVRKYSAGKFDFQRARQAYIRLFAPCRNMRRR